MIWKTLLGLVLFVVVAAFGLGFYWIKSNKNAVAEFIKKNPERSSVCWQRNDTLLADIRSNKKMPLASTVKIIIAIEFAQQAANGKLNPEEAIPLSDLALFYIPDTDGGAHPDWLAEMQKQGKIQGNTVKLMEITKGMILFSSNANTEFLMQKLGLDNINANLKTLNLPQHDPIYPFVSALFVTSNTQNQQGFYETIKNTSLKDYTDKCLQIHEKLKNDTDSSFRKTFLMPDADLQKIWSDRLPASTTKEYASVIQKINSRTYFPPKVQAYLDDIMEWGFVVNPKNKAVYKHLGQKGGSTAFVLTLATYARTMSDNRTELVFFFNDLTTKESIKLEMFMNDFVVNCISRPKEMIAYFKE